MEPLTQKAVKDITRRKLRTVLTVLGIAIGVMGLTAINIASTQLDDSLRYTVDASTQPDIEFFTMPSNSGLVEKSFLADPNVKLAVAQDLVSTRWMFSSGHYPL